MLIREVNTDIKHVITTTNHAETCRWCKCWKKRRLRIADEPTATNMAALLLAGTIVGFLCEVGSKLHNSVHFYQLSLLLQAAADLSDVANYHSFSEDDGKTWKEIEEIAPRINGVQMTKILCGRIPHKEIMLAQTNFDVISEETQVTLSSLIYEFFSFDKDVQYTLYPW